MKDELVIGCACGLCEQIVSLKAALDAAEQRERDAVEVAKVRSLLEKIAFALRDLSGTEGFEPAILDAMQEIWIRDLLREAYGKRNG
jgi:hypothetical protein